MLTKAASQTCSKPSFEKIFTPFIQAIFPLVSPNSALMPNWHLEAIADALTRVLRGEIRRLIIAVPPRSLKSICASVAFPAFALGHNPRLRFICASYAENLAFAHSRTAGTSCARLCISDFSQIPKSLQGMITKWSLQLRKAVYLLQLEGH